MPSSKAAAPIPVARRVNRFSYAIRNIVAAAKAVEARGCWAVPWTDGFAESAAS